MFHISVLSYAAVTLSFMAALFVLVVRYFGHHVWYLVFWTPCLVFGILDTMFELLFDIFIPCLLFWIVYLMRDGVFGVSPHGSYAQGGLLMLRVPEIKI